MAPVEKFLCYNFDMVAGMWHNIPSENQSNRQSVGVAVGDHMGDSSQDVPQMQQEALQLLASAQPLTSSPRVQRGYT